MKLEEKFWKTFYYIIQALYSKDWFLNIFQQEPFIQDLPSKLLPGNFVDAWCESWSLVVLYTLTLGLKLVSFFNLF